MSVLTVLRKNIVLKLFLAAMMVCCFTIIPACAIQSDDIKVEVNNQLISFPDQKPFTDNELGRTYVPLRFISEAMQCQVDWDGKNQLVSIKGIGLTLEMGIGSKKPVVNGEARTLDAPARVLNNRTMVPLRFISECLGAEVDWDGQKKLVSVVYSASGSDQSDPAEENKDANGLSDGQADAGKDPSAGQKDATTVTPNTDNDSNSSYNDVSVSLSAAPGELDVVFQDILPGVFNVMIPIDKANEKINANSGSVLLIKFANKDTLELTYSAKILNGAGGFLCPAVQGYTTDEINSGVVTLK